jgi:hypothetical protein
MMSEAPVGHPQPIKEPELFAEAQQLFASPPTPHEHPTDSFWLHSDPPFDEVSLENTKLGKEAYQAVIIGMKIFVDFILLSCGQLYPNLTLIPDILRWRLDWS